jgi:hypothetical protein
MKTQIPDGYSTIEPSATRASLTPLTIATASTGFANDCSGMAGDGGLTLPDVSLRKLLCENSHTSDRAPYFHNHWDFGISRRGDAVVAGCAQTAAAKVSFESFRFTVNRRLPTAEGRELALRRQLVSRTNGRTFIKAPAQV